ncbi:hypothetical protein ACWGIN_20085 [Streptomyces sp. NPDC054861]
MNLTHPHRQQPPRAVDLPELFAWLRTLPAARRIAALATAAALYFPEVTR